MDTNPATTALHQELLRHSRWLEHLARHLVREDEAAADLAQDTLLAALRRPPARLADLRPWLARVMRNRHRDLERRSIRRRRRETLAAAPEALQDSTRTVERLDLEQSLLNAVKDLAEPYRTAVTLRYLEAMEPAEIARRQGIPAGTVRWRVSEGLDRLRRALDQDRGGRETWVRALLPLAGLGAAQAELTVAAGLPALLLGSLTMKITLASAALVTGVLVTWALWGSDASRAELPADGQGTGSPAVVAAGGGVDEGAAGPVATPERTEQPGTGDAEAPMGADATPAVLVSVRVVDEQGMPLPHVLARSEEIDGLEAGLRTDGEGRLAHSWTGAPVGQSARLVLSAPGREARELREEILADGLDFGVVTLRPGTSVAGRVVDEAGVPQAGARVTADDGAVFLLAETFDTVVTDSLGQFRFEGLPEGFVQLRASLAGDRMDREQRTTFRLVRGQPREDLEIRVTRPDGSGLTSGVILRPDGTPSAHAELFAQAENERSRNTFRVDVDAEGRFTLEGWRYDEYVLSAVDREDPGLRVQDLTVARGMEGLVLRLTPTPLVALRVRDEDGRPVDDVDRSLYVEEGDGGRMRSRSLHLATRDGQRWFAPPSAPYEFEIRSAGYETFRTDRFDPREPREAIDVVLKALPRLTGQVTYEGEPVAGAEVRLLRAVGADTVVHVDDLRREWLDHAEGSRATTDEEGCFSLPYLPPEPPSAPGFWDRLRGRDAEAPRPFAVEAWSDGQGFAFSEPFFLQRGEAPPSLTLTLTPGGTIEGTLLLGAGEDPSTHWILAGNGFAGTRSVRPDAAGRFRLPDLPAGGWMVRDGGPGGEPIGIQSTSGGTAATPLVFDCEVRPSQTTRFDIDRRQEPRLRCRFLLDGRSPGPWTVALLKDPGPSRPRPTLADTETVDADGGFLLAPSSTGSHQMSLFGKVDGEGPQVELLLPVEILPGPGTWSFDVATAGVSGTCDPSVDPTDLQWRAALEGEGLWVCPVQCDDAGRFQAVVPLGKVSLVRADPEDPLGSALDTLRELEVGAEGMHGLLLDR